MKLSSIGPFVASPALEDSPDEVVEELEDQSFGVATIPTGEGEPPVKDSDRRPTEEGLLRFVDFLRSQRPKKSNPKREKACRAYTALQEEEARRLLIGQSIDRRH